MAGGPYFFSKDVTGMRMKDYTFHPHQLDSRIPAVSENSNVLCAAAERSADGDVFQGDATIAVQNIFCSGDPPGSGSVHVRVNIDWGSELRVRLAFVLWP